MKSNIKYIPAICAGVGLLAMGSIAGWVMLHEPVEGNHNFRSTHRKDGTPKLMFNSAPRANLQCIIQALKYGEICVSYREPEGYFTGHKYKIY